MTALSLKCFFLQLPGWPVLEWGLYLPDSTAASQAKGSSPSLWYRWQCQYPCQQWPLWRPAAGQSCGWTLWQLGELQTHTQVWCHITIVLQPRQQGQHWLRSPGLLQWLQFFDLHWCRSQSSRKLRLPPVHSYNHRGKPRHCSPHQSCSTVSTQ